MCLASGWWFACGGSRVVPLRLASIAALLLLPTAAHAQAATHREELPVSDLSLVDLLDTEVVSASLSEQSLAEAAAVIDVITQEDLRARGYRSVGDALQSIAGVDLMTVLFDATPIPQVAPHEGEPWSAAREPGPLQLAARGVKGLVKLPFELAGGALSAATHPAESLDVVKEALEGIGEVAWAGLNPAPETPLNVPIGPHRRLAFVRNDLADLKLVKNTLGGTVNDVVLTVVAGGLRSWLRARGVRTEGLELRALVPVSVRSKDQHHDLGNRIVVMRGPLPIYVEDPVARLRVVRQAMDGLKDSKQAVGAEVITGLEALAPPTILAQASRLQFSTRLFNLLVTNVPGPQFPLYVLGRELEDLFPVAFLPENQSLAVAVMSYNGRKDFVLLGDYDALPDLDELGDALNLSLEELVDAAGGRTKPKRRRPAAPSRKLEPA